MGERYSSFRFCKDFYQGFKIPEVKPVEQDCPYKLEPMQLPKSETLLIKRQMRRIPRSGK